MKYQFVALSACVLAATFLSGCIPGMGGPRATSIPNMSSSVDISYVEAKSGEVYDKKIDGATISLLAVPPKDLVKKVVVGINEKATWFTSRPGARNYAVTTAVVTYPESITGDFELRVDNTATQEIVSFEKVLVSMSVDGKMVNVDQSNYDSLRGLRIAPGLSLDGVLITGGYVNSAAGSPVKVQLLGIMLGDKKFNLVYDYNGGQREYQITQENKEEVKSLSPAEYMAYMGKMHQSVLEFNEFATKMKTRSDKYKTKTDLR